MSKRRSYDHLFEGNFFTLYCVFFTLQTILVTVTTYLQGYTVTLTPLFLLSSFMFIGAPLLPLGVAKYLWQTGRISERTYLFWIGIPMHHSVSSVLLLLFVTLLNGFSRLPLQVYVNIWLEYAVTYTIVILIAMVIDWLQTAKANQNLRLIQTHQHTSTKES